MKRKPQKELKTVRDWIRWSATCFARGDLFFGHGTNNAWDEAVALVMWVVQQPFDRLEWVLDAKLVEAEKQQLAQLIDKRVQQHIPLPYLTGEAWFAGLKFHVTPDVLIPRSPIAELIEREFQPMLQQYPAKILDLCTGSGCIGIACAYAFEEAMVDISDISTAALDVAQLNIANHSLQDRVSTVESDVFDGITGQYDLIVSNPPYVDAQDMASIPAEYQVEPRMALESGDDGLDITRRILAKAAQHLTEDGLLVVEVGNSWEALEVSMPHVPFYWPEFENGGHGIFMLTKQQLLEINKAA